MDFGRRKRKTVSFKVEKAKLLSRNRRDTHGRGSLREVGILRVGFGLDFVLDLVFTYPSATWKRERIEDELEIETESKKENEV